MFLDHHRIGTVGHHPAGENARRFARTDGAGKRPSGGDLADDFQAHRGVRHIAGAHGVAVHGGDVGRRLGAAGFQRINQDAASGLGKRDFFGR